MDFITNWIGKKILVRAFQPSSIAGYALAALTYLNWDPSASGQAAIVQFIAGVGALLLWLVNERPWNKRIIELEVKK